MHRSEVGPSTSTQAHGDGPLSRNPPNLDVSVLHVDCRAAPTSYTTPAPPRMTSITFRNQCKRARDSERLSVPSSHDHHEPPSLPHHLPCSRQHLQQGPRPRLVQSIPLLRLPRTAEITTPLMTGSRSIWTRTPPRHMLRKGSPYTKRNP